MLRAILASISGTVAIGQLGSDRGHISPSLLVPRLLNFGFQFRFKA
jgi:hypothetical protein